MNGLRCVDERRPIRLLVCGGRGFDGRDQLGTVLDELRAACGIAVLIEGGATGADGLARRWAKRRGIPVETFSADWSTRGPAAGPVRNQRMLDEGQPDLVVTFPGGRGTADMTRRAWAAGIELVEPLVAAA